MAATSDCTVTPMTVPVKPAAVDTNKMSSAVADLDSTDSVLPVIWTGPLMELSPTTATAVPPTIKPKPAVVFPVASTCHGGCTHSKRQAQARCDPRSTTASTPDRTTGNHYEDVAVSENDSFTHAHTHTGCTRTWNNVDAPRCSSKRLDVAAVPAATLPTMGTAPAVAYTPTTLSDGALADGDVSEMVFPDIVTPLVAVREPEMDMAPVTVVVPMTVRPPYTVPAGATVPPVAVRPPLNFVFPSMVTWCQDVSTPSWLLRVMAVPLDRHDTNACQ